VFAVIVFTSEDLKQITNLDLKYTQSKVGETILEQRLGCPIGGILSTFYANLFCSYRENWFIEHVGKTYGENRVMGIRQVDDLVVWIACKRNSTSYKEGKKIRELLYDSKKEERERSTVYNNGLTVTEEAFVINDWHFSHDFAGTTLTGKLDCTEFKCATKNKNWKSILENKRQKTMRYPPWNSYTHKQQKLGVVLGMLARISRTDTTKSSVINSMMKGLVELKTIDYPTEVLKQAIKRIGKKPHLSTISKRLTRVCKTTLFAS
jgi:hypothetical protein